MSESALALFLASHATELGQKTVEHLLLTGISTGLAIGLGLPLGVLVAKNSLVRGPVLGIVGVFQTIPSLAMLAFLLPLLGIGFKPAITALTLYALLPIVRNTYTGLAGIDRDIIEAAAGLGFTERQKLLLIELPLATPVIIAGIRTAAVIGVGIATLSSFIGAGGLGDYINRGLAMNNTQLILLGACSAAILALIIDFLLGLLGRALRKA
ncbi:ABC transporter permease [Desulfurivibrio dismutans]|uniref:ABC transporter permease n=1 Tax=Desulfurivibrio dismutans TaxID=1398908 RepID=UPI0023DBF144|nr:ABC transporter permease [Desulfurivibrio alkaliphilus]MDF1615218.1 ABC transporter permease [Desulfurivibrio alkaliphilus]